MQTRFQSAFSPSDSCLSLNHLNCPLLNLYIFSFEIFIHLSSIFRVHVHPLVTTKVEPRALHQITGAAPFDLPTKKYSPYLIQVNQ